MAKFMLMSFSLGNVPCSVGTGAGGLTPSLAHISSLVVVTAATHCHCVKWVAPPAVSPGLADERPTSSNFSPHCGIFGNILHFGLNKKS